MGNKKIVDMDYKEARKFLLKAESYCTLKLPKYFNFQPLLDQIHRENPKKSFDNFFLNGDNAKYYNDVNYSITINKSDKLSWRNIILTNPIAYVGIVQEMCRKENWNLIINRFKYFSHNKKIKCCSIPVEAENISTDKKEQILNWWNEFEQITIKESIRFKHMIITDISNCYPSIYTHTIPWALHGEKLIKQNLKTKNKGKYYGEKLDASIQKISYAQTNGISQGSILYDFIAEMVLGYCDTLLSDRLSEISINDYFILRYRDDYRIFTNKSSDANNILKELTIILNHHNLNINEKKTLKTSDIISHSLKLDKIYGLMNPLDKELNSQKKIFVIRQIGVNYKNSGLLLRLLHEYYKTEIFPLTRQITNPEQIMGIVVDIMNDNSRVYPECIAILSKLLSFYSTENKKKKIELIRNKINNEFNTDYLNIWLQRLTVCIDTNIEYDTKICQKIYKPSLLWNSSWTSCQYDENSIVDYEELNKIKEVVSIFEIDDFLNSNYL